MQTNTPRFQLAHLGSAQTPEVSATMSKPIVWFFLLLDRRTLISLAVRTAFVPFKLQ